MALQTQQFYIKIRENKIEYLRDQDGTKRSVTKPLFDIYLVVNNEVSINPIIKNRSFTLDGELTFKQSYQVLKSKSIPDLGIDLSQSIDVLEN